MKIKVKFKDFDGKEEVVEQSQHNLDHLKSQQTYKSYKFRDKSKFYRKQKHKQKFDDM